MTTRQQVVAVTGATGFIGNCLCRHLLARGYAVRALVRDPAKAGELESLGVALVAGDLNNRAALETLLADCDAIAHGAGAVRGNSQEDFDRVNVAGTANVLWAIAAQASPPKLVMLSSIVAREPGLSWYSQSKWRSEQLLDDYPDLDWVALRPPAVYGPGDKEMLPIFQWMRRGIALVPGSPDARNALVHVTDVVGAIEACLPAGVAKGQVLALCDGRESGYSWRDLADIAGQLWSREVRLWQVPRALLDSVARINSAVAGITGGTPMLTPPKLRELRHEDWTVDNAAITAATGWVPKMELPEGLRGLNL